jgi:hypothetical protein
MRLFRLKIDSIKYFQSKNAENLFITQEFDKSTVRDIINVNLQKESAVCDEKSLRYVNVDNALYVEGIAVKTGDKINSTNPDYLFL